EQGTGYRSQVTGDRCRLSKFENRNSKLETRNSDTSRASFDFRLSSFDCRQRARHSSLVTRHCSSGFSLIEMMVVITLILILASFAMPTYHIAVIHAREAVLRNDLFTMRKMIDEYTIDKQHPPSSLDELVEDGYLPGG